MSMPRASFRTHPYLWLGVILLLAFLLRAGWGLSRPSTGGLEALPDQVEYITLARNLLNDNQLSFYDHRENVQQWVWAYRMPGYPLFLTACRADLRVVRMVQALIGTLTVLAAYLLARRWLEHRVGLLAACIVAINPFLIYFSALILSETLYTALLAWGMVLLTHSARRADDDNLRPPQGFHRPSPWTAAGILCLALGVLVRPSGLFVPIFLAVGAVWMNRCKSGTYQWSAMLGHGFVAAVVTAAVLVPWGVRNHALLRHWIWTTTNGGITLYDGFNPHATGASDQSFLQDMPQVRYPLMGEVDRSAYFAKLARHWMWEHPWEVAKLTAVKIARTWSPVPLSREYGGRSLYVFVASVFTLPLDILILLGLAGRGLNWRARLFLLLPAIYFTLIHGMSVGSLRYRVPMEPALAVLAAWGVMEVWRRTCGRTAR